LNSTWGSFKYASLVTATLNINGVVTRHDADAYGPIEKREKTPDGHYTGWGEYLGWAVLDLYNPKGNKQLKYNYLTTSDSPDFFSLSNAYGLTLFPTDFNYTPNFSDPLAFTQNITVTEPIASATDLLTVNIDLTVTNKSNPSLGIKPNVNIEVGGSGNWQTYNLDNGKTTLSLKLSQPYIVHGMFGTSSGVGILTVTEVDNNYVAKFIMTIGSTPGQESSVTTAKTADKSVNINYAIPVSYDVFNQFKNH
jgi:hypothetical protein